MSPGRFTAKKRKKSLVIYLASESTPTKKKSRFRRPKKSFTERKKSLRTKEVALVRKKRVTPSQKKVTLAKKVIYRTIHGEPKTTPIPVKFDRQGHSCNFYVGFGPTFFHMVSQWLAQ